MHTYQSHFLVLSYIQAVHMVFAFSSLSRMAYTSKEVPFVSLSFFVFVTILLNCHESLWWISEPVIPIDVVLICSMIFFVTYVCKIQTTCFMSSYKWTIKFAKTTKMTFPKTSMQGLLLLFIWFERMIMWSEAITCYSCNEFPAENFKDCSSNTTLVDFGHRKDVSM